MCPLAVNSCMENRWVVITLAGARGEWKLRRQFYRAVKNRKTAFFPRARFYRGKWRCNPGLEQEPWPSRQILECPGNSHTLPPVSPLLSKLYAMCSDHLLYAYDQHSLLFLGRQKPSFPLGILPLLFQAFLVGPSATGLLPVLHPLDLMDFHQTL